MANKPPPPPPITSLEEINVGACVIVSDATTQTERGCGDKQTYSWIGKCQTANVTDPRHHLHVGAEVCVCDTELCNAEMISLGHVTTGGVAILLISVVIGYLL